ncbi:MAG: hypothetical protein ACK4K7_11355 [Allosphingosinicella sp.]|uniref:hypothetical protein n=1 Tax=Allosphingosinicella sp. TaxID=2823234 RepID=UPI00395E4362
MRLSALPAAAAALAFLGLSGCAYDGYGYDPGYGPAGAYGDYRYDGHDWRGGPRERFAGPLHGPGLGVLDPWLRDTREGNDVVTLGFSEAAQGFVSPEVAHRANIWFRRYADTNRDLRLTDAEIRVALVQAARDHDRR